MSSYEVWLKHQKELCQQGLKLVKGAGLRGVVIKNEGKADFIRVFFQENYIDFMVKGVKSKRVRSIWLCKVSAVKPKSNWLVFTEQEKYWMIIRGEVVIAQGEKRPSDFKKSREDYYVVPPEMFRGAKTFFKHMKERFDEQMQKRMNDFF